MATVEVRTFSEALDAFKGKKRHLLLGNGFSRALKDDIFAYGALFERADFASLSPNARRAFDALGTTDFEVVMRALRSAARLAEVYAADQPGLAAELRRDADGLREVLAKTIAQSHPALPGEVPEGAYRACRAFLAPFDRIYTLNYDLLLYWALMQTELPPPIEPDDGFRKPEEGHAEYVTWSPSESDTQRIFYLHGALHLFDAGTMLKKMTWKNTGTPLIQQIRTALESDLFPLVVAEGSSDEKKERILHSGYLSRGLRSFAKIRGALFVHGFAMSDSDAHWLRLVERGKVEALVVGLHGKPESPGNQALILKVAALQASRPDKRKLDIAYYDAASARVWG